MELMASCFRMPRYRHANDTLGWLLIGLRRLLPLNNKAIIPLNSLALAHLCAIYTE
uniref:Uncharacterized protein n=1 Tax=Saccharomyces cerevisiae (strain ATCC 204508 / S288c) TaxID=559292 RepID=E9PAE8_YEAST|nr:unknown [Saccharomyces cerevisiae]